MLFYFIKTIFNLSNEDTFYLLNLISNDKKGRDIIINHEKFLTYSEYDFCMEKIKEMEQVIYEKNNSC